MNKLIPLSMLLGFSLPVLAAPTLVSEQVKQEGKLGIPYQMYKLDNGLTVILAPTTPIPWCIWTSPITSAPPGKPWASRALLTSSST